MLKGFFSFCLSTNTLFVPDALRTTLIASRNVREIVHAESWISWWREDGKGNGSVFGVPLARLLKACDNVPVARIMPNVLCSVGEGATCYCVSPCTDSAHALLLQALRSFGLVHAITEDLFDAYCAISGSSPAFVCSFVEALIDGGVKCGLPRQLATEAALQSVRGTATLVQMKEIHPALLRDDITSPGGTTIAGVLAMERRAFRAAVADAVEATCERSKEIGLTLSKCS
ncbi:pyrroline-5-carboxylate reductase, putative [Eimeria necatrix]|uniref:Pyrroline-5-carboxylate reductase, putative n=1 Tax=Eimeria necatrix TaxID=51315 RepID=U6MN10_9EIME|nr:pyrroline-5-carboxylate reductase, putative [Eimeria necatrix]CDJ64473.1 pyrroline-5-carboxylate reductase, putative [Eimeria necatrix]